MRRALAVLAALVAAALVVAIADPPMGDYSFAEGGNLDNSAPALGALVDGDIGRAIDVQPIMGPVTLVLRWPFAAAGNALGGRELEYAFGAAACLWVLAFLAGWLAVRTQRVSRERLAGPVVALLLVANPATLAALSSGHPEELVTAALATAAVIAAGHDRPALTGLLLALAVASKPWAALAGPVALLVLARGYTRTIVIGALLTASLLGPMIALNPQRARAGAEVLREQTRVNPASVWWPLAEKRPVTHVTGLPDAAVMPAGLTRSAGQLAVGLLTLGLSLAYARRRRPVRLEDGLALLAGIMLARGVLDPFNLLYYAVPFVVALVAWEALARRGIPVISIAASLALWATAGNHVESRDLASALYLAWSLPLAGWLVLRPARLGGRAARVDVSRPVSA
jgi:hypothetical protein